MSLSESPPLGKSIFSDVSLVSSVPCSEKAEQDEVKGAKSVPVNRRSPCFCKIHDRGGEEV